MVWTSNLANTGMEQTGHRCLLVSVLLSSRRYEGCIESLHGKGWGFSHLWRMQICTIPLQLLPSLDLNRSWCAPSLSLWLMKAALDKFPPTLDKPAHKRILLEPPINSGIDQKKKQWAKCGHSTFSMLLCQTTCSLSQDHLEVCHPHILF